MNRVPDEEREDWIMSLNEPLPGQEVTPEMEEAEGEAMLQLLGLGG